MAGLLARTSDSPSPQSKTSCKSYIALHGHDSQACSHNGLNKAVLFPSSQLICSCWVKDCSGDFSLSRSLSADAAHWPVPAPPADPQQILRQSGLQLHCCCTKQQQQHFACLSCDLLAGMTQRALSNRECRGSDHSVQRSLTGCSV